MIAAVHDVSLQVLSMFSCSWSNSVKYLDHDQLLEYLVQTIQFLGFSLSDDVVAVDCSHRVRLKAAADLVTYLECRISCFFENSVHVPKTDIAAIRAQQPGRQPPIRHLPACLLHVAVPVVQLGQYLVIDSSMKRLCKLSRPILSQMHRPPLLHPLFSTFNFSSSALKALFPCTLRRMSFHFVSKSENKLRTTWPRLGSWSAFRTLFWIPPGSHVCVGDALI